MKNLNSIPHALNEIFSEINQASQIVINYSKINSHHNINGESEYKINSVNNFTSPETFFDYLSSLCSDIRKAIIDQAKEMELAEQTFLFFEAYSRAQDLSYNAYLFYLPATDPEKDSPPCNIYHLFKNPSFTGDTSHLDNNLNTIAIGKEATTYAKHWSTSLQLLQYQLICHLTNTEYNPADIRASVTPAEQRVKLPVNGTVAIVAVFFRILYESRIFDTTNKSMICRVIAEVFRTPNQHTVSTKSFKNHFDCPPPDTLDLLGKELSRWKSQIPHLSQMN